MGELENDDGAHLAAVAGADFLHQAYCSAQQVPGALERAGQGDA